MLVEENARNSLLFGGVTFKRGEIFKLFDGFGQLIFFRLELLAESRVV
jgi:hypothetical protein